MMRIIALTKITTGSVSTVPWPRQVIGSPSRTIQADGLRRDAATPGQALAGCSLRTVGPSNPGASGSVNCFSHLLPKKRSLPDRAHDRGRCLLRPRTGGNGGTPMDTVEPMNSQSYLAHVFPIGRLDSLPRHSSRRARRVRPRGNSPAARPQGAAD